MKYPEIHPTYDFRDFMENSHFYDEIEESGKFGDTLKNLRIQ